MGKHTQVEPPATKMHKLILVGRHVAHDIAVIITLHVCAYTLIDSLNIMALIGIGSTAAHS